MSTYKVSIEGQTLELSEEIAGKDETLKSALVPYFPGAANAKIMRDPEKDGVIKVTVVKQAGTKGLLPSPLDILTKAPESRNPVVQMHREMKGVKKVSGKMGEKAMQALREGIEHVECMQTVLDFLQETPAEPSLIVPEGF